MKIICVGRNYAAHAQELANAIPDQPLIFLKPETAVLEGNAPFVHPSFSKEIHWECELVYRVAQDGSHVSREDAGNTSMASVLVSTSRRVTCKTKSRKRPSLDIGQNV
jgi:2-keto-4-pentenoate hydratase/2-oxohepta-3-ene-1,7-dioic acid hydratase in catechol pathway